MKIKTSAGAIKGSPLLATTRPSTVVTGTHHILYLTRKRSVLCCVACVELSRVFNGCPGLFGVTSESNRR